jgi:amino acid transporter
MAELSMGDSSSETKKQNGVKETAKSSSTRWWEFYAVRYAMGTGVGAIVFYFLCSANPGWRTLLFDSGPPSAASPNTFVPVALKLDRLQLGLLVTYGLVYCYIASAPILVFHATRFLLQFRSWWWLLRYMLVPTMIAIITWWSRNSAFWTILGFLFAFIVWAQYWNAFEALFNGSQLYRFYERLANRREQANVGGILDSYRHLREHGNSFFIVSLEIILGFALFAAGFYGSKGASSENSFLLYLAILFVWIFPSVLVWLIATNFEREFSEGPLKDTAAPPSSLETPPPTRALSPTR